MGGHSWEFASDEETREFRSRDTSKDPPGFYKPGPELHGVLEVARYSLVRDRDENVIGVAAGEKIRVLTGAEIERYRDQEWIVFAEEVHVGYGQGVESLRTRTPLAVLPDLE
tara:strand:+ start:1171 stop:1506 length:336 start_codon:yes stop_codon:yes gene_type:complete